MEDSKPKGVNSILNIFWVNLFRLGGLNFWKIISSLYRINDYFQCVISLFPENHSIWFFHWVIPLFFLGLNLKISTHQVFSYMNLTHIKFIWNKYYNIQ